jgi:hypothetical protein
VGQRRGGTAVLDNPPSLGRPGLSQPPWTRAKGYKRPIRSRSPNWLLNFWIFPKKVSGGGGHRTSGPSVPHGSGPHHGGARALGVGRDVPRRTLSEPLVPGVGSWSEWTLFPVPPRRLGLVAMKPTHPHARRASGPPEGLTSERAVPCHTVALGLRPKSALPLRRA